MFKVKYVDSIMMLVRLDLNLIVSLFQHKCEVSEKVSTTTLIYNIILASINGTGVWLRIQVRATVTVSVTRESWGKLAPRTLKQLYRSLMGLHHAFKLQN